jgi:hypothetical protein
VPDPTVLFVVVRTECLATGICSEATTVSEQLLLQSCSLGNFIAHTAVATKAGTPTQAAAYTAL